MRILPRVLALFLTVSAAAACQPSGADGPPVGAPAPSASGTSEACRSGQVTVTEADGGGDLCITVGTLVEVALHGTDDAPWSAPAVDSPALAVAANGRRTVPRGVTAGYFRADAAGTARITAARGCAGWPACPSPGAFAVTVRVR